MFDNLFQTYIYIYRIKVTFFINTIIEILNYISNIAYTLNFPHFFLFFIQSQSI